MPYRRVALLVLAVLLTLSLPAPGIAPAAPGDRPFTEDGSPQVGLSYLGAADTMSLPGQHHSFPLTFAVPEGTLPTAITGRTVVPASVAGGSIDVLQGHRLLSRTPVSATPNALIRLGLTGLQVDRGAHSATVTLRTHLRAEGFCAFDPDESFLISDARVVFAGAPAPPRTVADFLPPALTTVTLYVPADPRSTEGAAAVNLATAIVAHYHPAPVQVETRPLRRGTVRPPSTAGPLERQIVIAESLPAGLALADDGEYLTLGGPRLDSEAAFLTSDLSVLALGSAAIPGPAAPAPQLARDVSTLADIGNRNQQISTIGWPSLSIGIDQTRLGRPSRDIRVQLRGTYTPPPTGSGGQVVVTAGEDVVASWPADAQGSFDRWVTVPNSALRRYTELRVTVERGDTRTACGDAVRSSLSLSAAGAIEASPADPPVPSGFQSLPQALMPRMQLAWTNGDVADIARAVSVMTGLQRLSAVPLGVDVVEIGARNDSLPAVLIAADGTDLPHQALPISSPGEGRIDVIDIDGHPAVTNIPRVPFGSLQVIQHGGEPTTLVATSTGSPALLDEVLAWLDADPTRWRDLDGVAVLQAADSNPVVVAGAEAPHARSTGLSPAQGVGVGAVVLVAVLAALGGLLFWRRRRTVPLTSEE